MKLFPTFNENFSSWYLRLLVWREKHIKERTFVLILALAVGIVSGFAALLLKYLIHVISGALTSSVAVNEGNYLYLLWPVIGVLLTSIFVRYVVRDNISHGVTRVLYAISQKKSRLKPHNMWSSLLGSSVTIGFGGSVGAEGPIVYTGAAIGSNLGSAFHMSPRVLMILVGCGAAAGIAGIFKAPIAGMLFTIEVLMLDLTAVSVLPLMISSVAAASIAYTFTGYESEFFFSQSETFITPRIPYAIALGIFCGFVSLYFTKAMNMMERMFGRLGNPWLKFAVGGAILSLLIFLFPPLYGEGYGPINSLLNGNYAQIFDGSIFYDYRDSVWMVITFVTLIILSKVFATSATNGGGGVGGTFAPSLYVGCMAGFLFAILVNTAGIAEGGLSIKNFALMGMAGVMFAQRGELLTHEKDKTVLTLLKIDNVIEKDFLPVHPEMSLKEMVDVISHSNRNLFPVTDEGGTLLGIVLLDDIRNIMFRPDLYRKIYVSKFMTAAPAKIEVGETMDAVMKKFDDTNAWNLPVVENGKYVGFVSKSKIFNSYRRVLKHYTDD